MRDLCLASASPSVSSWPLVVGSLKSGALSPTCSTNPSLSALENVPARTGDAGHLVSGVERRGQCFAHGHAPCMRKLRIGAPEGNDVLRHLTGDHARG